MKPKIHQFACAIKLNTKIDEKSCSAKLKQQHVSQMGKLQRESRIETNFVGVFRNFDVDGACLVHGYYTAGNGKKCLKWYIY